MSDARVALVGYGLAGKVFHAPLIADASGLSLDWVVTSNPARAAEVVEDHPGAVVLPDVDALFARPDDFDLLVIATTNDAHVPRPCGRSRPRRPWSSTSRWPPRPRTPAGGRGG